MFDFEKQMQEREDESKVLDMIIGMMIDKGDKNRTHILRAVKAYGRLTNRAREITNKLMQEEKEHDGVLTDAGKATAEQMIMIMENTMNALEGLAE